MLNKKRKSFLWGITIVAVMVGSVYFFMHKVSVRPQEGGAIEYMQNLPVYTTTSLLPYDGTNEKLPIYVAMDGYVYDVTPGKKFYVVGGTYHSIAGKDASSQLHTFGGSIIREKYKVVGLFSN